MQKFAIVPSIVPVWGLAVVTTTTERLNTTITERLNAAIQRGSGPVYTGGQGVIIRNPLDEYDGTGKKVVPASFWVNDMNIPTPIYVTHGGGNVDCPNSGTNGYFDLDPCSVDPFEFAALAFAMRVSEMGDVFPDVDQIQSQDWGWGVFYSTDSNSVDYRCSWQEDGETYDCPGGNLTRSGHLIEDLSKLGAGGHTVGNPWAGRGGGGAGCHYFPYTPSIDQVDAISADGTNLVSDYHCQCDYSWKSSDWASWVDNWVANASPKPNSYEQWLGGRGLAPAKAVDSAACWVNNPRDMILLQNQLYWRRFSWNNQLAPSSDWSKDPQSEHKYWGWNEVPIPADMSKGRREAVIIVLPGAICTGTGSYDRVNCFSEVQHKGLEDDLQQWLDSEHISLGVANVHDDRPALVSSSIVWARQFVDQNSNWQREFFADSWFSPSGTFKIHHVHSSNDGGCCYLDTGASTSPSSCLSSESLFSV